MFFLGLSTSANAGGDCARLPGCHSPHNAENSLWAVQQPTLLLGPAFLIGKSAALVVRKIRAGASAQQVMRRQGRGKGGVGSY